MGKRRAFNPEFKAREALEMISGEKGLRQAGRVYGIKNTVLFSPLV